MFNKKEIKEAIIANRNWFWNNDDCPKRGFKFVSKHVRQDFDMVTMSRKDAIIFGKMVRDSFND